MLIYIDLSVLSAIRNYDLEGKDCHCVQICTQPVHKGLKQNSDPTFPSPIFYEEHFLFYDFFRFSCKKGEKKALY